MQITKCKKNQHYHSNLSRDLGNVLFQITLGMQEHTHRKRHDNTVTSIDVYIHATNKQNNSITPGDIGALFWRIFDMPGHA